MAGGHSLLASHITKLYINYRNNVLWIYSQDNNYLKYIATTHRQNAGIYLLGIIYI